MSLTAAEPEDRIKSYISHLDLDSLRVVFELIANKDRPDRTQPSVGKCWMRVGHVCRLWRGVLLDMPLLWARDLCAFGVNGPFEDILARVQDAPLHLGFRPELPDYTLSRMAPLISRARVLRCTIQSPEDYQSITEALSSRYLSNLKTLSVTFDAWSMDKEAERYPVVIAHECPIHHLHMTNIVLRPPLNGCLTRLHVRLRELEKSKRFLLDEIVVVLQHNLALESVILLSAMRGRHTTRSLSRISLPVLSRLEVIQQQGVLTSFALLGLLHAPSIEYLDVADASVDTISKTAQALDCTLGACAGSPVLALDDFSLGIRRGTEGALPLDICLWRTRSTNSTLKLNTSLNLGLFPGVSELPGSIEMLLTVLQHLSDATISRRVVELQWYPWRTEADSIEYWNAVLPYFAAVSAFLIAGTTDGLAALFDALSQCEDEPCLLPRLTCLTIEHVGSFNDFPWSAHFENMFRRRMASGSPIREVRLKNLTKPIRQAMMPRYTAIIEQMERLAESIGVETIMKEWKDVEEIIGTCFEFQY